MSILKSAFIKVLKTSLIISLAIYIPLSLVLSVVGVDDQKKKESEIKAAQLEASLKTHK